ncbi:MAG: hypothetical protein ACPL1A_07125 [Candidatus Kapaibacteriota bacterium]
MEIILIIIFTILFSTGETHNLSKYNPYKCQKKIERLNQIIEEKEYEIEQLQEENENLSSELENVRQELEDARSILDKAGINY